MNTAVQGWWFYESLVNRLLRRKTFYFRELGKESGIAYRIKYNGALVPRPFKLPNDFR